MAATVLDDRELQRIYSWVRVHNAALPWRRRPPPAPPPILRRAARDDQVAASAQSFRSPAPIPYRARLPTRRWTKFRSRGRSAASRATSATACSWPSSCTTTSRSSSRVRNRLQATGLAMLRGVVPAANRSAASAGERGPRTIYAHRARCRHLSLFFSLARYSPQLLGRELCSAEDVQVRCA